MINLTSYKRAGNQTAAEENLLGVLRGAEPRSPPRNLMSAESGSACSLSDRRDRATLENKGTQTRAEPEKRSRDYSGQAETKNK